MTVAIGIAAIVLAGGRSRRMGRAKAMVDAGGEPLVVRVCRAVAAACDPVLLVAAPDQVLPAMPDVRLVRDMTPFAGPLLGVWTGLAAIAPTEPGRTLITGVDAVAITPELIRALALAGPDAVAVAAGERVAPLPVVVPVSRARREAERLLAAGERRLRALIAALDPHHAARAALLADPDLARVDPELRGLDDADDPTALARLLV